jgi:hypothetical protein
MKTIIKIILLTYSAAALFSCTETIELDMEQASPRIIVDGLITNEDTDHYVRLTESVGFYQDGKAPGVSGAVVEVTDSEGNLYNFTESETATGLYTADFQGMAERTYSLHVTLPDGRIFTAADRMEPVMAIDRLEWQLDEDEQEDPAEEGFFYRILIYGEEPAATKDYYLFKFYRNDTVQNFNSGTGIFIADDELIGGYINGLESPEYYKAGDEARFEMYRISRDAYLFYNDLANILNGDGGMTSPSPVNPRSNIFSSEGAELGFFQVSAVDKTNITVGE